jgi:histidyl-tRNA synthetase
MFRHENVQKGRQRQFTQFGAESFGIENPIADAEQIIMLSRLWDNLGLKNIKLVINSIGDKDCRQKHRHELIEYFKKNSSLLDEDSKRRLNDNPLRILDSKNPQMQDMLNGAPKIMEYLNEGASSHFNELKRLLDENQVKYEVNSRLVRGLDYYNRTVYEWISNDLGSQGTIAGGGRYDYLIENLGGKPTFACGFAIGIERIVLLLEQLEGSQAFYNPDIYIVCQGHGTQNYAINIAEKLRGNEYKVLMNLENSSFKSQFKKADKSNAKIAIIIGEDELKNNIIQIKLIRNQGSQESVSTDNLLKRIKDIFKN